MFRRKKAAKADDMTKKLFTAVKKQNWPDVQEMIENDNSVVNLRDKSGVMKSWIFGSRDNTILHWACRYNKIEIVQTLLEKGANIHATSNPGWTPLHYACLNRDFNVVQLLLDNNATINATNKDGVTPLHCACRKGDLNIVTLLISNGADMSITDKYNISPLDYARGNAPVDWARSERHTDIENLLTNEQKIQELQQQHKEKQEQERFKKENELKVQRKQQQQKEEEQERLHKRKADPLESPPNKFQSNSPKERMENLESIRQFLTDQEYQQKRKEIIDSI